MMSKRAAFFQLDDVIIDCRLIEERAAVVPMSVQWFVDSASSSASANFELVRGLCGRSY